jgi:hypothetical protein
MGEPGSTRVVRYTPLVGDVVGMVVEDAASVIGFECVRYSTAGGDEGAVGEEELVLDCGDAGGRKNSPVSIFRS